MDTDVLPTTDTRRTARLATGTSLLTAPQDDDDARRPLPTDADVPRETLDVLAQARDALVRLVSGVFQAAEAIVTALLRLVQSVAGRDVAEAVDDQVADVLDPLVPRLPALEDKPLADVTSKVEAETRGDDTATGDPVPTRTSDADLKAHVRDVLLDHADGDAERAAVSPAFVEMVTTGVRFALSVERQFPGAVDALLASDAPQVPAETCKEPAAASGVPSAPDDTSAVPADEPAVAY